MTPQEKAIDLINRYYKNEKLYHDISFNQSKICALVAVNELIESHLLLTTTHDKEPSRYCKTYWKEVKSEIEKL
jgi:hypothetical protein